MARLKLQKVDDDTNAIINKFQKYLFKLGVRTNRERAWEILQYAFKLPFDFLIENNKEIEYQGQGRHLTSAFESQLLVIKELGRFELKAVSDKKDQPKKATIRYSLPKNWASEIKEKIKVKE